MRVRVRGGVAAVPLPGEVEVVPVVLQRLPVLLQVGVRMRGEGWGERGCRGITLTWRG